MSAEQAHGDAEHKIGVFEFISRALNEKDPEYGVGASHDEHHDAGHGEHHDAAHDDHGGGDAHDAAPAHH